MTNRVITKAAFHMGNRKNGLLLQSALATLSSLQIVKYLYVLVARVCIAYAMQPTKNHCQSIQLCITFLPKEMLIKRHTYEPAKIFLTESYLLLSTMQDLCSAGSGSRSASWQLQEQLAHLQDQRFWLLSGDSC